MNKLITNKITLILLFVIICPFAVKAQDSAKKVIVVVRPGGIIWTPAITAPARIPANSASSPTLLASNSSHLAAVPVTTPAKSTPSPVLLASNSSHLAAVPATTGNANPTTVAQKSTSATPSFASTPLKPSVTTAAVIPASSLPAAQKTVASVTPAVQKPVVQYVAPGSRPTGYIAPSLAERTGTSSYMHRAVVPASTTTPVLASIAPVKSTPTAKFIDSNKVKIAIDTPVKVVVRPGKTDTISKTDTVLITKLKTDTVDSAMVGSGKHMGNKIIFAELGGPGLAISLNYDQRFKKGSKDGFGFRVGVGYFAAGNNTVFTVPLMVNYLFGKDGKYIELGLGTTFLNSKGDNYSSSVWEFDDVTGFIATAVIGVRYEPNKALNFRLGYVPILYDEGLINAGGFSIGYTF